MLYNNDRLDNNRLFPTREKTVYEKVDGRCHNLKNGKEASEDTEENPAECTFRDKIIKT